MPTPEPREEVTISLAPPNRQLQRSPCGVLLTKGFQTRPPRNHTAPAPRPAAAALAPRHPQKQRTPPGRRPRPQGDTAGCVTSRHGGGSHNDVTSRGRFSQRAGRSRRATEPLCRRRRPALLLLGSRYLATHENSAARKSSITRESNHRDSENKPGPQQEVTSPSWSHVHGV